MIWELPCMDNSSEELAIQLLSNQDLMLITLLH